jgi:hypothetical protein
MASKYYRFYLYSRVEFCWISYSRDQRLAGKLEQCRFDGFYQIITPSKLAALGLLPSNMLVMSIEFGHQGKKKNQRSWDSCKEEQVANKVQQFDWYGHDADDGNVYLPYGEDGDEQGDAVEKSAQFDWKAAETGWTHFSLIETPDQLYSGVLVCWQVRLLSTSAKVPDVKYV